MNENWPSGKELIVLETPTKVEAATNEGKNGKEDASWRSKNLITRSIVTFSIFAVIYIMILLIVLVKRDETTSLNVTITQGTVAGYLLNDTILYRNIPYVKKPERFSPPEIGHYPSFETSLLDDQRYIQCPQQRETGYNTEDCLVLNVHSPDITQPILPVMVFIHGGSFSSGAGYMYDGTWLAKEGVVVVTVNYRLGVFGYYADLEIMHETTNTTGGMNGLLDQVAALKWVEENIAHFGGDAGKVTIFGESAGGMSVCMHLTSQLDINYHRAIMMSGACTGMWTPWDAATGQYFSSIAKATVNVASLAEFRNLSMEEVLNIPTVLGPSIDGLYLPIGKTILDHYLEGNIQISSGDIMMGITTLEGIKGSRFGAAPEQLPNLKDQLSKFFPAQASTLITKITPLIEATSNVTAVSFLNGYVCVGCATRLLAKLLPGSRLYKFGLPIDLPRVSNNFVEEGLAWHAFDLGGVFPVDVSWGIPYDETMSSMMVKFWTEFAKNGTGMIDWPVASNSSHRVEGYWYFDATSMFLDRPFDSWDVCDSIEEGNPSLMISFCWEPFA